MTIFARLVGWWAALSMLLATLGTCPCCGGPPCARGVALLGLVGAIVPTFWRPKARDRQENDVAEVGLSPTAAANRERERPANLNSSRTPSWPVAHARVSQQKSEET